MGLSAGRKRLVSRRGGGAPRHQPGAGNCQNRALVYDPKRDLVLLVLGTGGDQGKTQVFALRYRHNEAVFVK